MVFAVDNRILTTSAWLFDGDLSSVYIKNDANFPWFILVPRVADITEIFQLSLNEQQQLIREISRLSRIVSDACKPDKLNIGALGNIVSQLHIHIVARFKGDIAWPHGVWQPLTTIPYEDEKLSPIVAYWQRLFKENT